MSQRIEYGSWYHMNDRCHNKNSKDYKYYGSRGITVCDSWRKSYQTFINDMGPRPGKGWSIDRIDNDKGYYKENCRWAERATQNRNKRDSVRVEINGKIYTLYELSELTGIKYRTLQKRHWEGLRGEDLIKPCTRSMTYNKSKAA